jgi:hypothetical protein
MPRKFRPIGRIARLLGLCALAAALLPAAALAEEHPANATLTARSYRQHCLLCHKSAAPEGVAAEILTGLHPTPGLKPAALMPDTKCWRRCEKCWPQTPPAGKK